LKPWKKARRLKKILLLKSKRISTALVIKRLIRIFRQRYRLDPVRISVSQLDTKIERLNSFNLMYELFLNTKN
jgi:hypothetical protein